MEPIKSLLVLPTGDRAAKHFLELGTSCFPEGHRWLTGTGSALRTVYSACGGTACDD